MKQYVIYHETIRRKGSQPQFGWDFHDFNIVNRKEILRVNSEKEASSICKTLYHHDNKWGMEVYFYEEVE